MDYMTRRFGCSVSYGASFLKLIPGIPSFTDLLLGNAGQVQSIDGSDASTEATDDERRRVLVLQALGRKCSNTDPVDGDASCQTKVT
jgi:hypothetical protein